MTVIVRRCTKDDVQTLFDIINYSYSIPESEHERVLEIIEMTSDEWFVHIFDGTPTAVTRCIPFHQNIRGIMKKMAGISMVASVPEYRRRGHTRTLMVDILTQSRKEGNSLSALYPFKDTFYTALGYVKMPPLLILETDPKQFYRIRMPDGYTSAREMGESAIESWRQLHEYAVRRIHGSVLRSDKRWEQIIHDLRRKIVVARNPKGDPEGVLTYSIKGFGEGHPWAETGQISINSMFWKSLNGRDALLHFLYLHEDQVKKVRMILSPTWADYYQIISDFHTPKIESQIISLARIIDVETSLSGFPSTFEDEIFIYVEDSVLSSNTGTYSIRVEDGYLISQKVDERPSVSFTIEGLTALLYGVLDETHLQHIGWLTGQLPASLKESFPLMTPWLTEDF